ncbi:unnamed protein product [Allacma fusca]|uniref:Uncharacterized protein n=1 Tax=Allacma fusca TaxID=39272 RepID=A0A8J2LU46_9HEXA|nr:unnamed protein product [Allacma fusca]
MNKLLVVTALVASLGVYAQAGTDGQLLLDDIELITQSVIKLNDDATKLLATGNLSKGDLNILNKTRTAFSVVLAEGPLLTSVINYFRHINSTAES